VPLKEAPKFTAEDLFNQVRDVIKQRGTLGIRGLSRVFKILDNNRNRKLDIEELQYGLGDYGISLDNEQAKTIL